MPLVSGGGGGVALSRARVVLTDAQIKALPTVNVTVIPAPGSGYALVVVSSMWQLDARGGAYTNLIAVIAYLNYGTSGDPASFLYSEAAQGALADASAVHVLGTFLAAGNQAGGSSWLAEKTDIDGVAVTAHMSNGAAGNLTGGNAANSLTIDVIYYTLAL